MVGLGSQYAAAAMDEDGNYLDGGKSYKLHLPANAPAKDQVPESHLLRLIEKHISFTHA